MLQIGPLKLRQPFILAPMAGVTDLPFRLLNRKFGCELAFIEMINCRSLSYKSRKTKEMLSTSEEDKPLGVQLLGMEPKFILKGLEILNKHEFAVLDFNAACPAKKVVTRGEGSALLKDPKKLHKLLKLVVENSRFPVTVKIRAGWDSNSVNAREVALYAQDAGIKALFIHGRTRMQEYGGSVDYGIIKKVKEALDIPVIGSGDVFTGQMARKMADETGCDGVAVARGALGNPWIFNEIKACLKDKTPPPRPGMDEIQKVMIKHLKDSVEFHKERIGVVAFRKFFSWYTKGWQNCRHLRKMACDAKTVEEMLSIIKSLDKHAVLV